MSQLFALGKAADHGGRFEVLCIGAHCDDIEIGCGGTILALQDRYANCRIHWLLLTSTPVRHAEALAAAAALLRPSARGEVRICNLPDGQLPAHFAEVKRQFEAIKHDVDPDLVFTHHGRDLHQDHSLVCQVTWQTFRDHLIFEYEIPKYEGDLSTPNVYVPLTAAAATKKTDVIMRSFVSQTSRSWFTADNLLSIMRLRGLESRAQSGFAEGFHCRKLVLSWGAEA
jgi:LmbE family N-acetylglucosaminyl deacetylase